MYQIPTKKSFSEKDFQQIKTRKELVKTAKARGVDISDALTNFQYLEELTQLQSEMVNLQQWVAQHQYRVFVIFEGRDASGKGGAIKRFKEHLNPRSSRVVALSKPTPVEQGQWYFRRYIKQLPNPGELVFFDRSWYNRAVVEPVMGFCSKEQYQKFMVQVSEFEHLLYEDNVKLIKFWFSISKEEQKKRFESRLNNPLKQWKFSPVDLKGQELWNDYTHYKEQMFSKTHTNFSPWMIVKTNQKREARLESIRYLLSQFDYDGKGESGISLYPDPNVMVRYHRSAIQIDI